MASLSQQCSAVEIVDVCEEGVTGPDKRPAGFAHMLAGTCVLVVPDYSFAQPFPSDHPCPVFVHFSASN